MFTLTAVKYIQMKTMFPPEKRNRRAFSRLRRSAQNVVTLTLVNPGVFSVANQKRSTRKARVLSEESSFLSVQQNFRTVYFFVVLNVEKKIGGLVM